MPIVPAVRSAAATRRHDAGKDRARLGPRHEAVAVDACGDVGSRQRERFAQVERGRELGDGVAPGGDFLRRGRVRQPVGERFLAGARPRQRQQLEQRAAAEDVQVVGVQMTVVAKTVARLAGAGPPILDAREAALVELNGRVVPRNARE